MKSTGIFRRIDELGRIVIPKELRKTLRLQTGDNVEIYLNDEYILLKKFSLFKGITDYSQQLCDVFNECVKKNIVVCDTNSIIACSGIYKKELINSKISLQIEKMISNRLNNRKKYEGVLMFNESFSCNVKYIVNTIIVNGDAIGIVIIFSENITESDEKNVRILSNLLEKQIEF